MRHSTADAGHRGDDAPTFLPLPLLSAPPPASNPAAPPPPHRVPALCFRSLSPSPRWCAWAAAALRDGAFLPLLRSAGVADAVAASTASVIADRSVLSALLALWCPAAHAFALPSGPATFTLEDALVLAGLPPSGGPLDKPLTPVEDELRLRLVVEKEKIKELHPCACATRRVPARVWLEWFDNIRPGEDDELRRLGFLAYWLAFAVTPRLRPGSGELPVRAFALAARLSLGERIALGSAVVTNLYADMDRVVTEGAGGRVDVWAPFWLLQAWAWERFEHLRPAQLRSLQFPISNARILHWSRRRRTTTQEKSARVLQDKACFKWRPYLYNSLNWTDPGWFNVETISVRSRDKDKPEWFEDYLAIIRPAVLTGCYGDGMDISVLYNPHIVARQFGYDQVVPLSISDGFESEGIEVWVPSVARRGLVSKEYIAWWNGQFERPQEADLSGSLVPVDQESRDMSPLDADKGTMVETMVDQHRQIVKQESIKCFEEELLAQQDGQDQNKSKKVVLALSACHMNSKTRKEKKERRDKFTKNEGKKQKKSKVIFSECDEGPQVYAEKPFTMSKTENNSLQLEDHNHAGIRQEDPKSNVKTCDDVAQLGCDEECIILESHCKKCELIHLDSDGEQSIVDPDQRNRQLVQELEEFVHSGLLLEWGESSDEAEGARKQHTINKFNDDPYDEEVMARYPLFFTLIPQKPHYRGLENIDGDLRDLIYRGMWFLLVDLAREVLKTSCDSDASEITNLMKKAQKLGQLGFNVKHLIARLKEPQARLRRLQDAGARLEDARRKEQEARGFESLSNRLSKLKHNIQTMQRHLDENMQAFIPVVQNKMNEGSDLVSLEKEVEAAEKYFQAMKDEVAAMRTIESYP